MRSVLILLRCWCPSPVERPKVALSVRLFLSARLAGRGLCGFRMFPYTYSLRMEIMNFNRT